MILRKGDVRVPLRDHLRKVRCTIPRGPGKSKTSAARKASAAAFPVSSFDGLTVSGARSGFIDRIRQGDPRADARHVGETAYPEPVAFADQQRKTAILREETRLRLGHSESAQLSQGFEAAHNCVGGRTRTCG